MRIKKVSKTTQTGAQIVDGYSNSRTSGFSCKYLNDINSYSTDETFTGKYWIDGKPIYRKVFTGTTGAGGSWENVSVSNLNIDNMTDLKVKFGNTEQYFSGFYINDNYNLTYRYTTYNSTISYMYGPGYSNQNYSIICEYTKITD